MDSFLSFFVVILSWFIFYAFLRNIKHVSERFSYDVALLRFRRSVLNQGTSKLQPCLIYSSYASWVFRENHINAKKRKRKNIYYVPILMPWYWMHLTLKKLNMHFLFKLYHLFIPLKGIVWFIRLQKRNISRCCRIN